MWMQKGIGWQFKISNQCVLILPGFKSGTEVLVIQSIMWQHTRMTWFIRIQGCYRVAIPEFKQWRTNGWGQDWPYDSLSF